MDRTAGRHMTAKRRKTLRGRKRTLCQVAEDYALGEMKGFNIGWGDGGWLAERGWLAGYRAGTKDGKAAAMKDCGWGEPSAALRDRRK